MMIPMIPMSLWESGESTGQISLRELFDNPDIDIDGITSKMQVEDLIMAACRGGWPAALDIKSDKAKFLVAKDYVDSVCRVDISKIDGAQRDERLAKRILQSYARNISTVAKKTAIMEDITASGESGCSQPTFDDYISALTRLFHRCLVSCSSQQIKHKMRAKACIH